MCRYSSKISDPKSGYIPGAKSVPHPELLDKNTGLLKDIEVIKQSRVLSFRISFSTIQALNLQFGYLYILFKDLKFLL